MRTASVKNLKRSATEMWKRVLAGSLAAVMVCTNTGTNLTTAYASDSTTTFEVAGSELVRSLEEAIVEDNEVTAEDLDLTNGETGDFEELLFSEGKILEAFPIFDEDGGMEVESRVFIRVPDDADQMYALSGEEDIFFMYVNNTEDSVSCTTRVVNMKDGKEDIKKTKLIKLKSFEAAFGDEDIDIISNSGKATSSNARPAETTTAADETTAVEGTTVSDETTAGSDVADQTVSDETVEEVTDGADETVSEDETEETADEADETVSEDETEEAPDEADETVLEDETEEASDESDKNAASENRSESDDDDDELSADGGGGT